MQPIIVLDKSFLQSVTATRIGQLAETNSLVMTDALFHELLTTDAITRARCFAKLPQVENPVRIVGHIGPMLLHEQRTNTKSLEFLSYEMTERYRFNAKLCNVGYELPPDASQHTQEETEYIRQSVDRYIARTAAATSLFPLVTQGSDAARLLALRTYETDLAAPDNILAFYRNIGDTGLPPHNLLRADWATFRLYQISLLFSLHTLHRHRGPVPKTISNREYIRLEHDVHDSNMLLTAAMAGGLATKESKLIRWWQLLLPGSPIYLS